MASCPTCAAALDQNLTLFFCHSCQASLQPLETLASTLARSRPRAGQTVGIFAGQARAIVLPALVMLAFYQPLGWRWDFWRYPVVVVAAVGFVHALFLWVGVARGTTVMLHGSAVGDDAEGDMERLVREFSWTTASLARSYVALALACLFLRRAVAKQAS
jgi:hypothetical protein